MARLCRRWLGWTLNAFDVTIFLRLTVPIAKDFDMTLTEIAIVLTLTLGMRLIGATASGWLPIGGAPLQSRPAL
jgi:MFS transporter, SHS family, lactate transporter